MSQAVATPASQPTRALEPDLVFDQLYRESRDDVYAYAAGLLRDRATAEEVTATAFERAYRKRSRFNPGRGSARAWLFGIARNAAPNWSSDPSRTRSARSGPLVPRHRPQLIDSRLGRRPGERAGR